MLFTLFLYFFPSGHLLIYIIPSVAFVILVIIGCCVYCLCCRNRRQVRYEREDKKMQRRREEAQRRNAERRAERRIKTDAIRQKYGLLTNEDDAEVAWTATLGSDETRCPAVIFNFVTFDWSCIQIILIVFNYSCIIHFCKKLTGHYHTSWDSLVSNFFSTKRINNYWVVLSNQWRRKNVLVGSRLLARIWKTGIQQMALTPEVWGMLLQKICKI